MADSTLAVLSDRLLVITVLLYAAAMLAFAGDQASRSARRTAERTEAKRLAQQSAAERTRAMAGAGGSSALPPQPPATSSPGPDAAPAAETELGAPPPKGRAGQIGMAATLLGLAVHAVSIVTRGLAVDRVPWGNMYEFSSAVAFTAVAAFVVLVLRGKVTRGLGAFVMLPVVLYIGLAVTVLYTEAGPLVPALDSYWIKIHVAAAVLASGAFLLSGMVALLYLLRHRHDATVAAGGTPRFPVSLGESLPSASALDRATYVVIAFAFPIWTFAIIAGAIWAEAAWGRYWGWDPKETWSFITWVLYAGYLHARATAGWKGRRAAWIAVLAALALIIDYYVVNIFVTGLHSYA